MSNDREKAREIADKMVEAAAKQGQLVKIGLAAYIVQKEQEFAKPMPEYVRFIVADVYHASAQHIFHTLVRAMDLPEKEAERVLQLLDDELTAWYNVEMAKKESS